MIRQETDDMLIQPSGSLHTQRCFMFVSYNMIASKPGWLFYMVGKIKMDYDRYGKTKGITLRADQFEALRIVSAATGKSINAILVEMIRKAIGEDKDA